MEREIRLQIMISPDELDAVETWRFKARMPSPRGFHSRTSA